MKTKFLLFFTTAFLLLYHPLTLWSRGPILRDTSFLLNNSSKNQSQRKPILSPNIIERTPKVFIPTTTDDTPVRFPTPDLSEWLTNHSNVAQAILWEDSRGTRNWNDWENSKKDSLNEAFSHYWNYLTYRDPAPNYFSDPPTFQMSGSRYYYSQETAWDIYRAYIAQALTLEISRRLSWSILDYSSENLNRLLDSRKMWLWAPGFNGYVLTYDVTPAQPSYVFSFLNSQSLLASSQSETIRNLLNWARNNLKHTAGDDSIENNLRYWSYPVAATVNRMIAGTPRESGAIDNWTCGCYCTVSFINSVLRSVNIPTEPVSERGPFGIGGHGQIYFPLEHLYLNHGDDLYNLFAYSVPPIPIEQFLLSETTYASWYRGTHPVAINRRSEEVAVQYLPSALLIDYCDDMNMRRSHQNGRVLHNLTTYSLEELETGSPATDLWQRMDEQIATLGGCSRIPNPRNYTPPYLAP